MSLSCRVNNRNRHIASALFGALLLLPLLTLLFLQLVQAFVQATREERLETEALVQVVAAADDRAREDDAPLPPPDGLPAREEVADHDDLLEHGVLHCGEHEDAASKYFKEVCEDAGETICTFEDCTLRATH